MKETVKFNKSKGTFLIFYNSLFYPKSDETNVSVAVKWKTTNGHGRLVINSRYRPFTVSSHGTEL